MSIFWCLMIFWSLVKLGPSLGKKFGDLDCVLLQGSQCSFSVDISLSQRKWSSSQLENNLYPQVQRLVEFGSRLSSVDSQPHGLDTAQKEKAPWSFQQRPCPSRLFSKRKTPAHQNYKKNRPCTPGRVIWGPFNVLPNKHKQTLMYITQTYGGK